MISGWKDTADTIHKELLPHFFEVGKIVEENQKRVLDYFRKEGVSEFHFQQTTGYGYDDTGREVLEKIYAGVMGAEAALVRQQLVSGTHAISTALFGVLRPGDELLYISGDPYDTLEEVIGIRGKKDAGSLKDFGITYDTVPLKQNQIDTESVINRIRPETKVLGIQRSRGYDARASLHVGEIGRAVAEIKAVYPEVIIFVDNCYGEFVETQEPGHAGADLTAGSLIKNPGGGIARAGAYICGRNDLIEKCASRMSAPGIGAEGGATLGVLLDMFQGFFLAPHTVGEALKGASFTAALLEKAGFQTDPPPLAPRTDLIQSVTFHAAEEMTAFCRAIQYYSPVDANVSPEPADMPGYEDPVIMAAGAFVQGASIELSADGPLRAPYRAYVQGGLTFEHVKTAVTYAVQKASEKQGK
ncbi:aminotransferase class I/II-fold pyridoxal phosphate-dependent enzyme [Alkalicoccus urumqiensis]|uniref:Aluminum resistance protein n=1 Tax=Alkalicoccus urumqiensis TaxID=1548213 RepID=A0A2P6MFT6_ALKUR|nr:methionine gamma-lyase family protein [Alkalicoccus urumqiensis]PRO65155.1 hypothetical protein C6I21_10125 [Alkalicoccus urumqiensis]